MFKLLNKNFLKQALNFFLVILIVNYIINACVGNFSQHGYQKFYHLMDIYLPKRNNEIIKTLFTNYEYHIDTSIYPKTFKEYKTSKASKISNTFYTNYNIFSESNLLSIPEKFIREKIIRDLQPKIHKNLPYTKAGLYPFKDTYIYYNKYGELVFILKSNKNYNYYRYNTNGFLIEAENQDLDNFTIYSANKQIKYLINDGIVITFLTHIPYKQYLITLNLFIILTTLILTFLYSFFYFCKISGILIQVNDKYLESYQTKPIIDIIIEIYHKLKKSKTHIWSLSYTITFWIISIISIIYIINPFFIIINIGKLSTITTYLLIVLVIIYLLEKYIFKNTKVLIEYLSNNKTYNIIWTISQIPITLLLFFTNYHFLYKKICSAKTHLWSHIFMIIGLVYLLFILITTSLHYNLELVLLTIPFIPLTLIVFLLILIETIFFSNFKIKTKFMYESKIYTIIWYIGIAAAIILLTAAAINNKVLF